MKNKNYFNWTIIGMAFAIGSLSSELPFPSLIGFAIGLGIAFGSVFKALHKIQQKIDDAG
ncbi:MAG: hypothetical protein ACP5D7_09270 [Limnospira sp.]